MSSASPVALRVVPDASPHRLASVSAVVPVHDEEATVLEVTRALRAMLAQVARRWEVIVVDDGSRDGTPALVDAEAHRHRDVRVVRHERNRGYGAAVGSGLAAATGEWVFLIDGDGQLDPAALPARLPRLGGADALLGYRERRADAAHRCAYGTAWNALVRRLLGVRARDVNCAFKLVRRAALAGFAPRARGGAVSAELLAHLARGGARVVETPVPHRPRRAGRASGGRPRVVLRAVAELAAIWWRMR